MNRTRDRFTVELPQRETWPLLRSSWHLFNTVIFVWLRLFFIANVYSRKCQTEYHRDNQGHRASHSGTTLWTRGPFCSEKWNVKKMVWIGPSLFCSLASNMFMKLLLFDTNTSTVQYRTSLLYFVSLVCGWHLHGWTGTDLPGVEGVLSR